MGTRLIHPTLEQFKRDYNLELDQALTARVRGATSNQLSLRIYTTSEDWNDQVYDYDPPSEELRLERGDHVRIWEKEKVIVSLSEWYFLGSEEAIYISPEAIRASGPDYPEEVTREEYYRQLLIDCGASPETADRSVRAMFPTSS